MSYFILSPSSWPRVSEFQKNSRRSFGLDGYFSLIYTPSPPKPAAYRPQVFFSFFTPVADSPDQLECYYQRLQGWLNEEGRFEKLVEVLSKDVNLVNYAFDYLFTSTTRPDAGFEQLQLKGNEGLRQLADHCLRYLEQPRQKIILGDSGVISSERELLTFIARGEWTKETVPPQRGKWKLPPDSEFEPNDWRPKNALFLAAEPRYEEQPHGDGDVTLTQIHQPINATAEWEAIQEAKASALFVGGPHFQCTESKIRDLLSRSPNTFNLVHIACHGEIRDGEVCLKFVAPNESAAYLKLSEIVGLIQQHQKTCRLLIVTACQSAEFGGQFTSEQLAIIACAGDDESPGGEVTNNRCIGYVKGFYQALCGPQGSRQTSYSRCHQSALRGAYLNNVDHGKIQFFPRKSSNAAKTKNPTAVGVQPPSSYMDDETKRRLIKQGAGATRLLKEPYIKKIYESLLALKPNSKKKSFSIYNRLPGNHGVMLVQLAYETFDQHAISCVWQEFSEAKQALDQFVERSGSLLQTGNQGQDQPVRALAVTAIKSLKEAIGKIQTSLMQIPIPGLKDSILENENYERRLCFIDVVSEAITLPACAPWLRFYWALELLTAKSDPGTGQSTDDWVSDANALEALVISCNLAEVLNAPFKVWHARRFGEWKTTFVNSTTKPVLPQIEHDYNGSVFSELFPSIRAINESK